MQVPGAPRWGLQIGCFVWPTVEKKPHKKNTQWFFNSRVAEKKGANSHIWEAAAVLHFCVCLRNHWSVMTSVALSVCAGGRIPSLSLLLLLSSFPPPPLPHKGVSPHPNKCLKMSWIHYVNKTIYLELHLNCWSVVKPLNLVIIIPEADFMKQTSSLSNHFCQFSLHHQSFPLLPDSAGCATKYNPGRHIGEIFNWCCDTTNTADGKKKTSANFHPTTKPIN